MISPSTTEPARAAPTLAERIAPHLPLLRRYARALSGSQAGGDAQVATLLEALIEEPRLPDVSGDARVALYAAFHKVWNAAGEAVPGETAAREAVAQERLAQLTPPARQALLLTAVEGFSPTEVAAILGVDPAAADALAAEGIAALKAQTRARVLIIEDEPIIAMDLEAIVADLGHTVVQIADTRDRAVDAAERHAPDLVLADIQLADGSSGIDAVQDILGALSIPVIFITAYPERLLTGARPEPTFLIAKPFQPETVEAAISQALFFREAARAA